MCAGSVKAKRKTFQPNEVDPSLKLVRTASASLAKLTGKPRAMARAALDALNEDADQACRLLLSGLALALLDACEVEELKPGICAWLKAEAEAEGDAGRPKILSEGAFAGCFLLRIDKCRKDPLRLFALEPVDVCLVEAKEPKPESKEPMGTPEWAELEYTEAPEVEGFKDVVIRSCSFDPGLVQVPLDGTAAIILVRVVKKTTIAAPCNSAARTRRRARDPDVPSPAAKRLAPTAPTEPRYQRLELIGTGTFGKVYLAERRSGEVSESTPQKVAVKQVVFENHKTREITLLESIRHSCIVSLLDSFMDKDENDAELLCMVLEYLPQTLHQKIGGQPLCVADVRCFTFQLLRALAHLDGLQIVHRDLKPENVLLDPATRAVKVADFGSAKVLTDEPSSSYICSRWWRAPELIFGATRYSTSVDWWSCGCICAEMMLGRPLFTGESSWGQMYEIIRSLGTPTLEEVKAMQAGSDGRLAGHFSKLAALERPPKAWEDLLPAFAHEHQALELPAVLLSFDPGARRHPAEVLRSSFFSALLDDSGPLPPNLYDFSEHELSKARRQLRALQRKAMGRSADDSVIIVQEPAAKRQRVEVDKEPEPIVRLISEDLSDIP